MQAISQYITVKMMSTLSVDKIIAKLETKNIPLTGGEPTYETLNELIRYMYANAVTLKTPVGGGQH